MKPVILLAFLAFFFGCNSNEKTNGEVSSQTIPRQENIDTVKNVTTADLNIVPGVKAGPITASTTEEKLIEQFGAAMILTKTMDAAEGSRVAATILFPGSPDEAEIWWMDSVQLNRPERVIIRARGSRWHIDNKIRIGTSLDSVAQINQKPFFITGCCFDYPFTAINWAGGKLASFTEKGLGLRFEPTTNLDALKTKIVGEKNYSVSEDVIKKSGMVVSEIFFLFNE